MINLKPLTFGQIRKCGAFPVGMHFQAVACLALVDDMGDTLLPFSEEGCRKIDELPGNVGEAIIEAVKAFCLNSIDYEELAKNYEMTRNDARLSGSRESSDDMTLINS